MYPLSMRAPFSARWASRCFACCGLATSRMVMKKKLDIAGSRRGGVGNTANVDGEEGLASRRGVLWSGPRSNAYLWLYICVPPGSLPTSLGCAHLWNPKEWVIQEFGCASSTSSQCEAPPNSSHSIPRLSRSRHKDCTREPVLWL